MDYFAPSNWHIAIDESFSSPDQLAQIQSYLNHTGYVVVLHSHFCGARGATPSAFDDFDDFKAYLQSNGRPGDIIQVWSFPSGEPMFKGKLPNENGEVPRVGAY
jgi:hypothetical protein